MPPWTLHPYLEGKQYPLHGGWLKKMPWACAEDQAEQKGA